MNSKKRLKFCSTVSFLEKKERSKAQSARNELIFRTGGLWKLVKCCWKPPFIRTSSGSQAIRSILKYDCSNSKLQTEGYNLCEFQAKLSVLAIAQLLERRTV